MSKLAFSPKTCSGSGGPALQKWDNGSVPRPDAVHVDKEVWVFGAVLAERGLARAALLEIWYDAALG